MKKFLSIIIAMVLILSLSTALVGCGGKEEDGNELDYALFKNLTHDEEYKVRYTSGGSASEDITIPYTEEELSFRCTVYTKDGKIRATENFEQKRYCSEEFGKEKETQLVIRVQAKWSVSFLLNVTMEAKPDDRIMPDFRLDPNGAVDYEENVRYVYEYDGSLSGTIESKQFLKLFAPTISIFIDGKEIELPNLYFGSTYGLMNSDGTAARFIDEKDLIGEFKLIYTFSPEELFGDANANEEYHQVRVELEIEVIALIK